MQATSARKQARAIHDDTQSAMIRIAPVWTIGAHALAKRPPHAYRKPRAYRLHVRAYRATVRAIDTACEALAWSASIVALPFAGAVAIAMVSPTASAGQVFAGKVFGLYADAWAIIQNIL